MYTTNLQIRKRIDGSFMLVHLIQVLQLPDTLGTTYSNLKGISNADQRF